MKEFITEIYKEEHAGISFLYNQKNKIEFFTLSLPIEIKPKPLGFKYQIILYKEINDEIIDLHQYEAILGDPIHFIINHINLNYQGIIAKDHPETTKIMEEIYYDLLD
jgi:hypothetical protein